MPISNEQFKNGLDDSSAKMLEFLNKNRSLAYDVGEIAAGIGWTRSESFWQNFSGAYVAASNLNGLVKKGLVEKNTIQGKDYYKAK
jgi:hypothetical protein